MLLSMLYSMNFLQGARSETRALVHTVARIAAHNATSLLVQGCVEKVKACSLNILLTFLLEFPAAFKESNQGLEAQLAGGKRAPPASGGARHATKPSPRSRDSETSVCRGLPRLHDGIAASNRCSAGRKLILAKQRCKAGVNGLK